MKYLLLTWSNLRRKKVRTLLTLFSIIVAFMLFGLLACIRFAFTGAVDLVGVDRLIVRHKISFIQPLPLAYEQRLEKIPGVEAIVHQTWFGGYYKEPKNMFFQCPVNPDRFVDLFPEFTVVPETLKLWKETRTGCIVGRLSAQKYNWKVGDKIPIFSPLWTVNGSQNWEFECVGIFDGNTKTADTTAMFFRYDYFDESRQDFGKGNVGWYMVRVDNPDNSAEIAKAIDKEFANSSAETKSEPEKAFLQSFVKQMGNIGLITGSITAAVFFTILLVSGNTISQGVRERTGELGVLKAIGYTSRQILMLVLLESCTLSALGGFVGLLITWIIALGGDPTPGGYMPLFSFPTSDLVLGAGISIALGLVTGIIPALQAMNLRVADALRRM